MFIKNCISISIVPFILKEGSLSCLVVKIHDIFSFQAISYARFSDGRRCNDTCDKQSPCFPILVPSSDPRISGRTCLGFTRTSATCNTGSTSLFFNTLAPRQQLNALTAFIDASNVYGNTERMANNLRNLATNRGQLREGETCWADVIGYFCAYIFTIFLKSLSVNK